MESPGRAARHAAGERTNENRTEAEALREGILLQVAANKVSIRSPDPDDSILGSRRFNGPTLTLNRASDHFLPASHSGARPVKPPARPTAQLLHLR
jgi:hypothetical protein